MDRRGLEHPNFGLWHMNVYMHACAVDLSAVCMHFCRSQGEQQPGRCISEGSGLRKVPGGTQGLRPRHAWILAWVYMYIGMSACMSACMQCGPSKRVRAFLQASEERGSREEASSLSTTASPSGSGHPEILLPPHPPPPPPSSPRAPIWGAGSPAPPPPPLFSARCTQPSPATPSTHGSDTPAAAPPQPARPHPLPPPARAVALPPDPSARGLAGRNTWGLCFPPGSGSGAPPHDGGRAGASLALGGSGLCVSMVPGGLKPHAQTGSTTSGRLG